MFFSKLGRKIRYTSEERMSNNQKKMMLYPTTLTGPILHVGQEVCWQLAKRTLWVDWIRVHRSLRYLRAQCNLLKATPKLQEQPSFQSHPWTQNLSMPTAVSKKVIPKSLNPRAKKSTKWCCKSKNKCLLKNMRGWLLAREVQPTQLQIKSYKLKANKMMEQPKRLQSRTWELSICSPLAKRNPPFPWTLAKKRSRWRTSANNSTKQRKSTQQQAWVSQESQERREPALSTGKSWSRRQQSLK